MVYNVLEDHTVLGQLYGVLFNLLDMFNLRWVVRRSAWVEGRALDQADFVDRAHLAHLLALLTRRVHVKPFRIQKL